MGALIFKEVNGKIEINHPSSGTKKEFTLKELERMVTVFLEYYQEGTTNLSPLTQESAIYNEDWGVFPPNINKKFKEYWCHRIELYDYVVSEDLFVIVFKKGQQLDISDVKHLTPQSTIKEIADIYFSLHKDFVELSNAETPYEMKKALDKPWIDSYMKASNLTQTKFCKPFKTWLEETKNIKARRIRCFICPLKSFCIKSEGWCGGAVLELINKLDNQKKMFDPTQFSELKKIGVFLKSFSEKEYQRWIVEVIEKWR